MDFNEKLLESLVEAIRYKRRNGPRFPTVFDLSHIKYDAEARRIELDLFVEGKIRKFDLLVDEVSEHGETSEVMIDESEDSEIKSKLDEVVS